MADGQPAREGAPPSGVRWVWVSVSYATFGLGVKRGVIVDAAPIAHWCIGQPEKQIADYWRSRGARFSVLPLVQ